MALDETLLGNHDEDQLGDMDEFFLKKNGMHLQGPLATAFVLLNFGC